MLARLRVAKHADGTLGGRISVVRFHCQFATGEASEMQAPVVRLGSQRTRGCHDSPIRGASSTFTMSRRR
jgi:hypothetical protein